MTTKINRTKIKLFLATAAVLLGVSGVDGFAQQREGRPPGPPPGGFGFGGEMGGPPPRGAFGPLTRDLGLSEDQQAQIQKIRESFEESTKSLQQQMRSLRQSDLDAQQSETFDETAVRAAARARADVQIEVEVARARMMSQINAVLTAEQKAKLAERRRQPRPPRPDQQ